MLMNQPRQAIRKTSKVTDKANIPQRGRRPGTDNDTFQLIRDVAINRFAGTGFDGTSLRDIASDAGVDQALISYRFGSKMDLWKSLVTHIGEKMIAQFEAIITPDTIAAQTITVSGHDVSPSPISNPTPNSAATALAQAMDALITINCANDEIPRFLLRDASHDPERSQWAFDHVSQPLLTRFVPLIEQAIKEGAIDAPYPAFFFLNFVYGLAANVVRRKTLVRLAPELAEDHVFRSALRHMLVEPHFRHG